MQPKCPHRAHTLHVCAHVHAPGVREQCTCCSLGDVYLAIFDLEMESLRTVWAHLLAD